MRLFWTADQAFLTRLSKSALINILASAPAHSSLNEDQRAQFAASQSKRSKQEVVTSTLEALAGTNWLPELLIMPCAPGAFEITAEGCATIAAA